MKRKEPQRDLSMDGLMSRCHGRQAATHMQKAQRFCDLAESPNE
ncbi:MAG: hypothetical protein WA125_07890 [Desulfosporosinus sp.]